MGQACAGEAPSKSKHDAVIAGLRAFGPHLRNGDAAEVWEFDNELFRVGSTRDERPHWRVARHDWRPDRIFEQLVRGLRGPGGGTEIGAALERVMRVTPARDVLLITDGKSYALDVQKLARYGRRVAVVLVGEDSLEANVGHLAAITGGNVFVATGRDIELAIETVRGGAVVKASWSETATVHTDEGIGAGVAAFAAGLAIARMQEAAAAELAEREGLCSHLTSLVLVDEAAHTQDAIPAMRKILLPSPPSELDVIMFAIQASCSSAPQTALFRAAPAGPPGLAASKIDWDGAPAQLLDSDLSSLDLRLAELIRELSQLTEVVHWADELKVKPSVLIIAALAYSDRHHSRTADRISRKIFGDSPPSWIEELKHLILSLV
jgi:hypothetical protein